ncbi:MAG: hypothetical protein WCT12_31215, partial [Verrucomicrobiota bacterium]
KIVRLAPAVATVATVATVAIVAIVANTAAESQLDLGSARNPTALAKGSCRLMISASDRLAGWGLVQL